MYVCACINSASLQLRIVQHVCCARARVYVCVRACVLAVYNKAQGQIIILNREFNLWTFLQGAESTVATFLAETCVDLR